MQAEKTRLYDLEKHADGVWVKSAVDDIDGITVSRYSAASETNKYSPGALTKLPDHSARLRQTSPLRVNLFRAFNWQSAENILEIGCGAGLITEYFAKQNVKIDAVEPNRSLAQQAAHRTREYDAVRIICNSFADLDFESTRYDAIIVCGLSQSLTYLTNSGTDKLVTAIELFLSECKKLLNDNGRLLWAVENSRGINFLFAASDQNQNHSQTDFDLNTVNNLSRTPNLHQWRELLSSTFRYFDEYYLYPDLYFTRVLLGTNYVVENQSAYQHLDGIRSKDTLQSSTMAINELLLYQVANENGYIGDLANSYLFVVSDQSDSQSEKLDFAHLPDFNRRPEFQSIVLKQNKATSINRLKLENKIHATHSGIQQTFNKETYYPGSLLSIEWQKSFLTDPRGTKFEQYLLSYFDFLKKLGSGVIPGMNVDAIANNIIVDSEGEYRLIDHEWQITGEKVKSDYVFYRAIVHFALRNATIFHNFKWINGLATIGDYLMYCFNVIGLNVTPGDLEPFRKRDCEFLNTVLTQSKGYLLSDSFGIQADQPQWLTYIHWRYYNDHYHPQQKVLCAAVADNEFQQLIFKLPATENKIECFRFFPFDHLLAPSANYFAIDSLQIKITDQHNEQRILQNLASSDEVQQANIHQGLFYGKNESGHLFMFNSNDTFLEFVLPDYEVAEGDSLQFDFSFRLSASHDYKIARYKYSLVQREIEVVTELKNQQIESLKEQLDELTQEFDAVKGSRIWRLLEAYRDSFKISGYPKKNLVGKLLHMTKLLKHRD